MNRATQYSIQTWFVVPKKGGLGIKSRCATRAKNKSIRLILKLISKGEIGISPFDINFNISLILLFSARVAQRLLIPNPLLLGTTQTTFGSSTE